VSRSEGPSRFLLRRLATSAVALAGVCVLVFFLIHLIPGDPVDNLLGETAPAAERERLRRALHLHEPLGTQFGQYLGSLADGSLGRSYVHSDRTVASLVAEAFPFTLQLALFAMVIAILLALPLGIAAALRPGSWIDGTAMTISLLGVSIPHLWLGPMLLMLFAIRLGWFPGPAPEDPSTWAAVALPAFTLGTALMAMLSRMTRASLLSVLREDYIRTAVAKGLPRSVVVIKHGLRNALIPVITIAGLQFGALLSGAIVTEKIFGRPGLGSLLMRGITTRDYPVIQGTVLVVAALYVLVNLGVDLAYGVVDPRIRRR
jgi:ABC-type dipeptide/oligopeptide/nickel transport system permease component